METVREVLERFNLNIDLSEELLNLEVRGGYKTYEIEYFDDTVSDDDVKYIFTSDRQFKENNSYFTLLEIYSSGKNSVVGDYITPDLDMPPLGQIYDYQGNPGPIVD